MRRLLSLALTALMIISMFSIGVFTTTASAAEVGGVDAGYTPKGTPISTAEEFAAIVSGDYYLAADIEIDTTNQNVFTGTLDGNGKTITVSAPLFADVKDVTFKNLTIAGEIDFASENNDWHCGTLAQEGTNITIENVVNRAEVIGFPTAKTIVTTNEVTGEEVKTYDSIYSGGLLGSVYGNITLKNCANYGEVKALVAAGLVGSIKKVPKAEQDEEGLYKALETTVLFENCHNFATISDEDCYDLYVEENGTMVQKKTGLCGGLLAYGVATTTTFQSCTNTADILSENTGDDSDPTGTPNGKGSGVSGGIMARAIESSSQNGHTVNFFDCINEGEVVGWSQIGGIGGWIQCDTQVYRCKNTGRVYSRNNYAAGIIGRPGVDYDNSGIMLRFYYCVNTGEVVGHRQYAGGITSYSRDSIEVRYCLNTGNMYAEGLVAGNPNSQNPHLHTVRCAGIVVAISPVADVRYCVNTGNMLSNVQSSGITCTAGSANKAGYNTFIGCLNTGDCTVYAKNNGVINFDKLYSQKDDGSWSFHYYYTPYAAAGILGYSYGSGATQAPRIIGCGVTGSMSIDYGVACGFLGYTNTNSAIVMGNYLTGELNGPGECLTPHQVTWRTDYQLEYCTAWIDRCDSQRYITDNYFPEGHATKYKLLQNNGEEITFDGYDCFFTTEELESGKLCYTLSKFCFEMFDESQLLFCQNLSGTDGKFPTSPYYYTQEDGSVLYQVVKEGDKYVNATFKYETTTEEPDTDEPTTEEITTEEITTEEVTTEEVTTEQPKVEETTKKPDETTAEPKGGCGGVIGTSIALLALALIAPAGVMLKKKDEE